MAKSTGLQKLEENLLCAICIEVFRDPVTLPCQHTYCRPCLQTFSKKSPPVPTGSAPRDEHVVSCPVCREPADLGSTGVMGLPQNRTLAEIAEIYHHDRQDPSSPLPSCDQHGQAYSLFCIPCEKLICNRCLADHHGHGMSDIQTECAKLKIPLVKQTEGCEKVNVELTKSASGWEKLENDIKQNGNLHRVEIEKAYVSAQKALNKWRAKSLNAITIQEDKWTSQCKASLKELELMAKRIQNQMMTADNLTSSSNDTQFVQDAGQLTTEIDNQLEKIQRAMEKQAEIKATLLTDLENNTIFPRYIILKEETIQKPDFKFTRTDNRRLKISDGGSVVKAGGFSTWTPCQAWTDGCLATGRVYWDVEVSVRPSTPEAECYCYTGVVRKGCDLKTGEDGRDCWYMGMEYSGDQFVCNSHQGGEVRPAYRHGRHNTGAQRLGVFLDCESQTLTFIDCNNNRVMCTVRGVCVSDPGLSPAVYFATDHPVSARFVTGDRATLPQVLSDMSHKPF